MCCDECRWQCRRQTASRRIPGEPTTCSNCIARGHLAGAQICFWQDSCRALAKAWVTACYETLMLWGTRWSEATQFQRLCNSVPYFGTRCQLCALLWQSSPTCVPCFIKRPWPYRCVPLFWQKARSVLHSAAFQRPWCHWAKSAHTAMQNNCWMSCFSQKALLQECWTWVKNTWRTQVSWCLWGFGLLSVIQEHYCKQNEVSKPSLTLLKNTFDWCRSCARQSPRGHLVSNAHRQQRYPQNLLYKCHCMRNCEQFDWLNI